jgi:hypothetical protein
MCRVAALDLIIQRFEGPGQPGIGQGCILHECFLSSGMVRRSEKFGELLSIHG